jgi:hypothetical protein
MTVNGRWRSAKSSSVHGLSILLRATPEALGATALSIYLDAQVFQRLSGAFIKNHDHRQLSKMKIYSAVTGRIRRDEHDPGASSAEKKGLERLCTDSCENDGCPHSYEQFTIC